MDRKVSTFFAISVITLIGGFLAGVFWQGSKKIGTDLIFSQTRKVIENEKNPTSNGNQETVCSKRAFEGEAVIQGWYIYENKEWVLKIDDRYLYRLPKGYEKSKAKLADGSPELIKELKNASENNPVEFTIKGYYYQCEESPLASISPGGEIFRKYLIEG